MMKKNSPERKPAKLPMVENDVTSLRRTVEGLTPIMANPEMRHHLARSHIIF